MRALLLSTALLVACVAAQAQTVYRCGPEGRVYSQSPCPQGKAVNVNDERSAGQRSAALATAQAEQTRGDALERERLHREAVKPAAAGKIDGRVMPPQPAGSAPKAIKKKKRRRPLPVVTG